MFSGEELDGGVCNAQGLSGNDYCRRRGMQLSMNYRSMEKKSIEAFGVIVVVLISRRRR